MLSRQKLSMIPHKKGIYVVLRTSRQPVEFLRKNRAGRYGGRDQTEIIERLREKWVLGTQVLYVGKACDVHERIRDLIKFGSGAKVGHRGGRYLWQVAGHDQFQIAWLETPGQNPFETESELMEAFQSRFRRWPFANMRGPTKGRDC